VLCDSALHQRGICEVVETDAEAEADSVHLQWGKARDLLWHRILEGSCIGGCHPVFSALCRKTELVQCLQKHNAQQAEGGTSCLTPLSLVIDLDDSDSESDDGELGCGLRGCKANWRERVSTLLTDFAHDAELWVLKESDSNRGENLFIIHGGVAGVQQVEAILQAKRGCWLLQQYVKDLLLLDGRKCHLRVHAVAIGDSEVAVHRHSLVLPASLPFTTDGDSLTNLLIHATNVYQQKAGGGTANGSVTLAQAAEIWSKQGCTSGLRGDAGGEALPLAAEELLERLEASIHEAVATIFLSAAQAPLGFFPLANCFQLFGIDFLVDSQLRLHVLEVNSDPSLSIFGEHLRPQAAELLADVLDVGLGMAHRMLAETSSASPAGCNLMERGRGSPRLCRVLELPPRFKASSGRGIVRRLLLRLGLLSAQPRQARSKVDPGSGDGLPECPLAAVSPSALGASAACAALQGALGWSVTDDARQPLAQLQWAAHKEIRWERVMDKSLAASCFYSRKVLASRAMVARLYITISAHLANAAAGEALWNGSRHPMPLTLSVKPGTSREDWEARVHEALRGSPGAPRAEDRWHCRPASSPCWIHAAVPRDGGDDRPREPVSWESALERAFGCSAAGVDRSGTWLLQRAVPLPLRCRGAPLLVRAHLLVAGVCVGLLHRQLHAIPPAGRSGERQMTPLPMALGACLAETPDPPARHPLEQSIWQSVAQAAECVLSSACGNPQLSGFLPTENCFELFSLRFAVAADGVAWLLGCETAMTEAESPAAPHTGGAGPHEASHDGAAHGLLEAPLVEDVLRAAIPLLHLQRTICASLSSNPHGNARPESCSHADVPDELESALMQRGGDTGHATPSGCDGAREVASFVEIFRSGQK